MAARVGRWAPQHESREGVLHGMLTPADEYSYSSPTSLRGVLGAELVYVLLLGLSSIVLLVSSLERLPSVFAAQPNAGSTASAEAAPAEVASADAGAADAGAGEGPGTSGDPDASTVAAQRSMVVFALAAAIVSFGVSLGLLLPRLLRHAQLGPSTHMSSLTPRLTPRLTTLLTTFLTTRSATLHPGYPALPCPAMPRHAPRHPPPHPPQARRRVAEGAPPQWSAAAGNRSRDCARGRLLLPCARVASRHRRVGHAHAPCSRPTIAPRHPLPPTL